MPAIKEIDLVHVALPTRREHKWTGLTEPIGGYILVKMTGDDGTVGWGEAPALKDWGGDYGRYFGESPGTTKFVIEMYLAPVAIGCEVGNIADLHQRMDAIVKGYPYAKAAVDIAAYDLAGRTFGVPVWQLLGGRVRDRVPVTHSIGLLDIDLAVEECRQVVDEGIRTIKIKVGVDPDRDVEIVRRVREAVGEATDLCVDANCGYATPHDAVRIIRAMEEYRLKYAEQPVEGIDRMAEVQRAIATPVMADEIGLGGARRSGNFRAQGGGDRLDLHHQAGRSVRRDGGGGGRARGEVPVQCQRIGRDRRRQSRQYPSGGGGDAVTLSCVVPVSMPAEAQSGNVGGIYYVDDLIKEPFRMEDGCVVVPDGPGFGIDIDEDKIAKYRNSALD